MPGLGKGSGGEEILVEFEYYPSGNEQSYF